MRGLGFDVIERIDADRETIQLATFELQDRLIAAGDQDHAGAQNNLGLMYDYGEGVEQNAAEAVRWYRLAAEQDHAGAQNNLAPKYHAGDGVDQDLLLSYMWSNISLAMGREEAQVNLDIVAEQLSADQIADAESQALEWLAQRGW